MTDHTLATALAQLDQADRPPRPPGMTPDQAARFYEDDEDPARIFARFDELTAADEPDPARCTEMSRSDQGWARCRRDDDGHQRHHVRGRSWQTTGPTPRLDLGHSCADAGCCRWPESVQPYRGYTPKAGDIKAARQPQRGGARK